VPRLTALSANGEIAKFASSLFASFVAKCRGWVGETSKEKVSDVTNKRNNFIEFFLKMFLSLDQCNQVWKQLFRRDEF
jgi:hypothetical protein